MDPLTIIHQHFEESIATKRQALLNVAEQVALGAILIAESLRHGRKILTCGNGGSAGDATHFSSEMVNRFETERAGLPAIALTADTSTLTSIANDYSYDVVFARQVCALGKAGDVLVAITTSGKSQNLISAVQTARTRGLRILALTGRDGGAIPPLLDPEDVEIRIPSDSTARIQESHLVVIHCLCDLIERLIFTESR